MSRQPIKILIFGAALRKDSLNEKLADLATDAALANGATVERVRMSEFDCPSYDKDHGDRCLHDRVARIQRLGTGTSQERD
jgi:NAD(P)H-dependent FMN reductase